MPTPQENVFRFQEIANRGLQDQLDPDKRLRFDEGVRRGVITLPAAQILPQPDPNRQIPGALDLPGVLPTTQPQGRIPFTERSLPQQIGGTGEMILTLATGSGAQVVGGVKGLFDVAASLVSGDSDALDTGAETVNRVVEQLTFQPRSEAGRQSLSAVSRPFQAISENIVQPAAEATLDVTGSPALAAMVSTIGETFPPGARRPGTISGPVSRRRVGQEDLTSVQQSTRVDITDPVSDQIADISQAASNLTGGQVQRAQNFELVSNEIQTARQVAKDATDALYQQARSTDTAIRQQAIVNFPDIVDAALASVDRVGNPILTRRLNELNQLRELQPGTAVRLDALSNYRMRLNRNRSSNASENRALGIIKGELDNFLESQFNTDMIKGDPAGIKKWQDATRAFANYKRTFDDTKTINQIATQELTPESVKQLLLNMNTVGAKSQSGALINRIGDIIGRDSPGFNAIRQEAIFDITAPLIDREPNISAFITNYDKFVKNNPTLVDALFPDSKNPLADLRRISGAIVKNPSSRLSLNLPRTIVRALWGNSLARNASFLQILTTAFEGMRNAVGPSRKRRIMADVLGYDINAPVLPRSAIATVGGTQVLLDEELTQTGVQ